MHTIDLVRHAESAWVAKADASPVKLFGGRMNEVDLSVIGATQATALGKYARENDIAPDGFFSSPAVRTLRTHELSALAAGWVDSDGKAVAAIVDDRLQELNWGAWTGQLRGVRDEEIVKLERVRLDCDFAPPSIEGGEQGESVNMVRRRMLDFFGSLAADYPPGHYWVHTHRNAIKSVAGLWMDWSSDETTENHLDLVSLTRFVVHNGKPELVFFNESTL